MRRSGQWRFETHVRVAVAAVIVVAAVGMAAGGGAGGGTDFAHLPNNLPVLNPSGLSATFSTQGGVDLTGEYFQAQGTNGRSCVTCHIHQDAWSINPDTIRKLFIQTQGTHPIFNPLDANNPNADLTTIEGRLAGYSMMLSHGVFRRGGAPRGEREWDVVAVDDPHGFATTDRIVQWRRVMPTINFHVGSATVNWDGGNSVGTDQHAGLINQADRNVRGAQQGLPAPPDVIADIVDFETSLSTAQVFSFSAGFLHVAGARGGPEALSQMSVQQGRFDLFDAWMNSPRPGRRQIARGQELFNNQNAGGGRCGVCHNAANNGTNVDTNVDHRLFDIRTASAEARTPDLPLYTFKNRANGDERRLTDSGRGNVTGLWSDLGRFKTPTIRALAARAPYFHNGIAATIEDVVRHYETHLGFVFTDQERRDLVAFLKAL